MRLSCETRIDLAVIVALSVMSIAAVVTTSNDIGITYDEPLYASQAMKTADWLQLLFTEPRTALSHGGILEHWNPKIKDINELQPSTTKWVNGIVGALTGGNLRAGTAVFFALLLASVYWFGARAFNRTVGLFAACALGTLPRLFGHAHLTTLDVPVAAMVMLTTALMWHAVRVENGKTLRPRWQVSRLAGLNVPTFQPSNFPTSPAFSILPIAAGVSFGLALNTKMNGLLVLPSVLFWLAVMRWWSWRIAVALFIVAPLTFFLTWPWLWLNPIGNAAEYFRYHLQHYPVMVTYFGRDHVYAPWHYPLVMIGITTPTIILLLAAAGMVTQRWQVGRLAGWQVGGFERSNVPTFQLSNISRVGRLAGWQVGRFERSNVPTFQLSNISAGVLLLCSLSVQLSAFMLPTTPKYNGVRIFLPVFPFLALYAGIGFDAVCRWLTQRVKTEYISPALLTSLLGLLCLTPSVRAIAHVHPFELSYYNALIGGVRGAAARGFEPTYWGETLLHALDALNKVTPRSGFICIAPTGAQSYLEMYQRIGLLRRDARVSGDPEVLKDADVAVFHTRRNELPDTMRQLLREGRPAFAQTLDGVPLVVVYTRDEIRRVLQ